MNDPRILAVATATPRHTYTQKEVRVFAARLFSGLLGEEARLLDVFDHAEIATRHSCVPIEWVQEAHTFAEKNARYVEEAVNLGSEVARRGLGRAQLGATRLGPLLFISSPGISA